MKKESHEEEEEEEKRSKKKKKKSKKKKMSNKTSLKRLEKRLGEQGIKQNVVNENSFIYSLELKNKIEITAKSKI